MAVYLAWFANLTHLSGLTFLRTYLYTHPRERYLRVTFMAVLFVMLVVSEIPTAFFNWPNAFSHLARKYITTGHEPAAFPERFISRPSAIVVTGANSSSFAACYFNLGQSARLYREQVDWYQAMQENHTMFEGVFPLSEADTVAWFTATTAYQSTLISILLLVFSFMRHRRQRLEGFHGSSSLGLLDTTDGMLYAHSLRPCIPEFRVYFRSVVHQEYSS